MPFMLLGRTLVTLVTFMLYLMSRSTKHFTLKLGSLVKCALKFFVLLNLII